MINIISVSSADDILSQTKIFQDALDKTWLSGGGTVSVPAGSYHIGGLRIRSNTTLHLCSGAELHASRNPGDYFCLKNETHQPLMPSDLTDKYWEPFVKGVERCYDFIKPGSPWSNAIIRIIDAENVTIEGEEGSVIDGHDCYDPDGEERYRGPHGISVFNSSNIVFKGYTIQNTGNWAHCLFDCKNIKADRVTVLAGHDGIHFTGCENVSVTECEFYTGDDCVAGFANRNVYISGCICNTACSGLRMGGTDVTVSDCKFFGPAKYFFRGSLTPEEKINGALSEATHRKNMLSMFTYYADFSVKIPLQPGNILIKNCTADCTDRFMQYNFSGNERWQTGRPLSDITFSSIKASGIKMPLIAYGDKNVPVSLTIKDSSVSFSEDAVNSPFIHAANYSLIKLENVKIEKNADTPFIKTWSDGGRTEFINVSVSDGKSPDVVFTDEPFSCKPI